ncbi:MAG: hypothetical protein R3F42_06720 [Pseudomonadota bacterium]
MKSRTLLKFTLLAAACYAGGAAADGFVDVKPFMGDFHGSGLEMATPYIKANDANSDGYPESITFQYRVYTAGTSSLVAATPPRIFPTPAIPVGCSPASPISFDFDYDYTARRRGAALDSTGSLVGASNRIHSGINMWLDCWDGSDDVFVTAVAIYSADLSGATSVWTKYFAGVELAGMDGVDTDDNLISDTLMLGLSKQSTAVSEDLLVVAVNPQTGATVLTPRFYPTLR